MSKRVPIVIGVAAVGVMVLGASGAAVAAWKWSRENSSIAEALPVKPTGGGLKRTTLSNMLKKVSETAQSITQNLK